MSISDPRPPPQNICKRTAIFVPGVALISDVKRAGIASSLAKPASQHNNHRDAPSRRTMQLRLKQ